MGGDGHTDGDVDRFFLEEIDSVPHLEALLLLWNTRPRQWSVDGLAARLYLSSDDAQAIVEDLITRELVVREEPTALVRYRSRDAEGERLIGAVEATYRREIIRVSNMIHAKGSPAVRAFARAFRVRKDRE